MFETAENTSIGASFVCYAFFIAIGLWRAYYFSKKSWLWIKLHELALDNMVCDTYLESLDYIQAVMEEADAMIATGSSYREALKIIEDHILRLKAGPRKR